MTDPVEKIIAEALERAGIEFSRDLAVGLRTIDFYLPDFGVYIECKQMFTERITTQMKVAGQIIVIQGLGAARAFDNMLNPYPPHSGRPCARAAIASR